MSRGTAPYIPPFSLPGPPPDPGVPGRWISEIHRGEPVVVTPPPMIVNNGQPLTGVPPTPVIVFLS